MENGVLVGAIDDACHPRFHDARLMGRDRLKALAQEGLVIETDLGDDGDEGMIDDVGRVEQTTHARLDDAHFDIFTSEDLKGRRGELLEFGCSDLVPPISLQYGRVHLSEEALLHHLAVNLDPVPSMDEMG